MLFEAVCERYRAINPPPCRRFNLFFTLQHSLHCGEKEEPLVLEIRQIRADSVDFERDFDEGELSDLFKLKELLNFSENSSVLLETDPKINITSRTAFILAVRILDFIHKLDERKGMTNFQIFH